MKRGTKLRVLFLIIPCFLAVIFAILYLGEIWASYQLAAVNILCVFFIALELAQAFTEQVNSWKVCGFVGSGAISGIAIALNVLSDNQGDPFSLKQLSFWGWLWTGLLVLSVISSMVIFVRMLRWNQDTWEEIRKWRQEYRKQRMEARRKDRGTRQTYKQSLEKEKADAKSAKLKDQKEKDAEIREQKHEQRLERLKNWKKYWESVIASIAKGTKSSGAVVAIVVMGGLFLVIPYSEKLQSIAFNWFDAVGELASLINIVPLQKQGSFFQKFANYVIFYIFLIIAIWLVIFLCQYVYGILTKSKKGEKETHNVRGVNFFEEYDTAIAILTVFTAVMFAFGNSGSPFNGLTDKWTILFTVILFILIVFVSVEVVRLVVEQIGQKNSLLKQLIQLIFIAILEFFVGLVLGVIISFEIEKTISSLLSIMFPQDGLSFKNKVQKKFNEMFNMALDGDDNNFSAQIGFSRKHIWRRYNRK